MRVFVLTSVLALVVACAPREKIIVIKEPAASGHAQATSEQDGTPIATERPNGR